MFKTLLAQPFFETKYRMLVEEFYFFIIENEYLNYFRLKNSKHSHYSLDASHKTRSQKFKYHLHTSDHLHLCFEPL